MGFSAKSQEIFAYYISVDGGLPISDVHIGFSFLFQT